MNLANFYSFYRTVLSCFPAPVLNFFMSILLLFVIVIFVRLIISFLG